MNKTEIEWCDMTWNPVTGCLGPDGEVCSYCYAKERVKRFQGYDSENGITTYNPYDGIAVLSEPLTITSKFGKPRRAAFPFGFDPTLHMYRLEDPVKNRNPKTIFVCSMSDLFGDWVPDGWIEQVFEICRKAPWHRYMFLTKNPKRYVKLLTDDKLLQGDNIWYGATVTDQRNYKKGMDLFSLSPFNINTFMSVEPLLGAVKFGMMPDLVIVGTETGKKDVFIPEREWIHSIVNDCRAAEVPVFMKDSIAPYWDGKLITELPWEETR